MGARPGWPVPGARGRAPTILSSAPPPHPPPSVVEFSPGHDSRTPLAAITFLKHVACLVGGFQSSAPVPFVTVQRDRCRAELVGDRCDEARALDRADGPGPKFIALTQLLIRLSKFLPEINNRKKY